MEYKKVEKYLKNNKKTKKSYAYSFFMKILICFIIVISLMILIKYDKNHKQIIYKYLYQNNISLAKVNSLYKKYFGDITPFENLVKENTKLVFNSNLVYEKATSYKEGVKLKVDENYLVPVIESGIVVFIGNKDDYGKTVIIKQTDGVDTWYGNIDNISLSLYDYVSKGEFLGEAHKNFYMAFQKDGKYINYESYLK